MTKEQWLTKFKVNEEKLVDFILHWHPKAVSYGKSKVHLPITAPNAEVAKKVVFKTITSDNLSEVQVRSSILNHEIYNLYAWLSDAWFGVPESTQAWNINGFSEAAALLDEPIDEEVKP